MWARGISAAAQKTVNIDIAGKVVVITGAARGIGRTLALGLASEGARVAVLAREREKAQLVVDEIGKISDAPPALAVAADMGDEAAVIQAAGEVDATYGRVDALINNAGWMPGRHPVLEMELAVFERVLRSNLIGSFLTTKHFAPLMIQGGAAASSIYQALPPCRLIREARRTADRRRPSTFSPIPCTRNSPIRASEPLPLRQA